jgi:hypothetical protein
MQNFEYRPYHEHRGKDKDRRASVPTEMRQGVEKIAVIAAKQEAGMRHIRIGVAAGPAPSQGRHHEHQRRDNAKKNNKPCKHAKYAHLSCPICVTGAGSGSKIFQRPAIMLGMLEETTPSLAARPRESQYTNCAKL